MALCYEMSHYDEKVVEEQIEAALQLTADVCNERHLAKGLLVLQWNVVVVMCHLKFDWLQ